jgi:hypothetical protein
MIQTATNPAVVVRTVVGDATPERLARSTPPTTTEDGATRFQDELLTRLASKGQLYPDRLINEACELAGNRYYADWYGSNMSPLQAIDYGKVSGGQGGSGTHMPPSRMAAQQRADYRAARDALGKKYREAVELILLEGQSNLVDVGKAISGAASPHTARSVAIERFTAGLFILARHYGFIR